MSLDLVKLRNFMLEAPLLKSKRLTQLADEWVVKIDRLTAAQPPTVNELLRAHSKVAAAYADHVKSCSLSRAEGACAECNDFWDQLSSSAQRVREAKR